MPITVNQTSDQIEFGDTTNSFSVPMGNFALVKNDHETVRYLKIHRICLLPRLDSA